MGETVLQDLGLGVDYTFSILERIDVGETLDVAVVDGRDDLFQYPRTDRRG